MTDTAWILLLLVIAVIAAAGGWFFAHAYKTKKLQRRFGPEYDRTVQQAGDRDRAESELLARENRVSKLNIRSLSPQERDEFAKAWRTEQARFVDDPDTAVVEADDLVQSLMTARGYPVADFENRAGDISVNYPNVVENYRMAHQIATRRREGKADTEELRKAVVYYRALFEELLEEKVKTEPGTDRHGETARPAQRSEPPSAAEPHTKRPKVLVGREKEK
jgi:hypothetical protein